MSQDTFRVITASYPTTDAALRDMDQVWQLWNGAPFGESYEAAVVVRDDAGEVEVVRRRNEPNVADARTGLVPGLALGVVLALFPAVGLGAGLVAGGAAGAGFGALSGHFAHHLSDKDLVELGIVLARGSAGLIVATRNPTRSVYPLLRRATSIVGKTVAG